MFNIIRKSFVKDNEESHANILSAKLLIFQKKIARLKNTINKFNDYLIELENFYQINKTYRITLIYI